MLECSIEFFSDFCLESKYTCDLDDAEEFTPPFLPHQGAGPRVRYSASLGYWQLASKPAQPIKGQSMTELVRQGSSRFRPTSFLATQHQPSARMGRKSGHVFFSRCFRECLREFSVSCCMSARVSFVWSPDIRVISMTRKNARHHFCSTRELGRVYATALSCSIGSSRASLPSQSRVEHDRARPAGKFTIPTQSFLATQHPPSPLLGRKSGRVFFGRCFRE